jgi:pyruvate dehydrogenase E1 component
LLSPAQIDALRADVGLTPATEWDRFPEGSAAAELCARVGGDLNNVPVPARPAVEVPAAVGLPVARPTSTQEAFGRLLTGLGNHADVAKRLVTTSPDVSVSTNLGGWINKVGVFAADEQPEYHEEGRLLRWRQGPTGRHIELGISEMNLFLLLGQLGLGHELHGELLLPVGTVYDPFVCRGLDAFLYGSYNAGRFVVVGTPSGITLAPEGGAHQSTITPSIGLELPGVTFAEPAFATALDWLLCDGLRRLSAPDGDSLYLRLSTRPVDQRPFEALRERVGDEHLRADVLAGGYRLVEPEREPNPGEGEGAHVVLVGSGAVLPEVLAAAELLAGEGVAATVVDVTSLDRLYRGWRGHLRAAAAESVRPGAEPGFHLGHLLRPAERRSPIVTVHDAASHAMAWLGSVFGTRVVPVGVDAFGQSGSIPEVYGLFDLLPDQLVNAALLALAG